MYKVTKMERFSEEIIPDNKASFEAIKYTRVLGFLREKITSNILEGDENNYFDLFAFSRRHNLTDSTMTNMREAVSNELKELGWEVKTSFGGTGLFVYSSEEPPPSCHPDEF